MVWLTGILAFVAFLQLIVFGLHGRRLRQTIDKIKELGKIQSTDMQASIAVAKESADAARDSVKLARDEFNAAHRPKLSVRRMKPHPFSKPERIHYVIVNIGETIATIKRHEITLCIQSGGAEQTPGIPLECCQLKRGESRPFLTNIADEFSYAWGIAADSSIVKIRGIVEYEDEVGTTRRTGFLRTYDAEHRSLLASDDKEENTRIKTREPACRGHLKQRRGLKPLNRLWLLRHNTAPKARRLRRS